ncbi:MAG TPA: ATPase, T2SS/T4P/T4SS family [Thermoanaerobaculia bacterium]|nr:ATPase, T2SS/T4P/T4SS family [Thermoanaerobaculia bacterium]
MEAPTVHEATLRLELQELGLWELLHDPDLTDLVVNPDGRLHTFGFRGVAAHPEPLPAARLRSCIATLAGMHRRVLDETHPILEVSLPFLRVRATVIVPPVTAAPMVALRIPPRRLLTLDDLVERRSLDLPARRILEEAVLRGDTVLVAGAVSTGKTVLASALLTFLVAARPEERLVVLEEGARELQVPEGSDVTPLLTPTIEELPMGDLLRVSLRLLPDRIVVGELRGAETLAFLKASVSGHPGLATVHATSATDAIARLTDLLEEAGAPASASRVARSVRLIVHMRRTRAHREVAEILRLTPPDREGRFETETVYRTSPASPGTD